MVSIEVVRGASSATFFRASFRSRNSGPRSAKKHDLAGALALTSHRPPPSFVPNSHVLVQVHAVGLEGLDRQIVSDRLGKGATGFVPGRGVLGRVVECGLEVSTDILRKGEWVIGLLDAKKVRLHRNFRLH
jgi:NADPH:quinone reductase-like Zn-dependent oxidoreductase